MLITLVALYGYQFFSFDNEARGLFRTNDEAFEQLEEIFEQFRPDENDCMVVVEAGAEGFFNEESIRNLQRLQQDLQHSELVTRVLSPLSPEMLVCNPLPQPLIPASGWSRVDWQAIEQRAHQHPLVADHFLTADSRHMLLILRIGLESLLVSDYQDSVDRMQEVIHQWNRNSPHRAHLTGIPPVRVEVFRSIKTDTRHLMMIGGVVAGVVAIIIFRNWALALMTFVGALVGCFWSLGLLSLLGVKINLISTILPVLVVVIGLTDAVHLIFDVRDSRMRGIHPSRAALLAVRRLGIACAATSVTTAIGFGSLAVSQIEVIKQFGVTCAVGTLITFLAVILVVPLLAGTQFVGGAYRGKPPVERALLRRLGFRYADLVLRYRVWILVGALALISFLGMTALKLYPDSHLRDSIPRGSQSAMALQKIDEHFGGMLSAMILVEWDAAVSEEEVMLAMDSAVKQVNLQPDLHQPLSMIDFNEMLQSCGFITLPKSVARQWYRPDIRRAVVVARMRDKGVHFHKNMLKDFRAQLAVLQEKTPGVQFSVSGSAVVATRNLSRMILDLAQSLGIAAVIIFMVLTIMFRSLRLGLVSLVPNVLPLMFTAAFLVWTGQALRLTSILLFSVSLGIAVDDTIHFLVRFRRERQLGRSVDDAIRHSIVSVGAALIVSTMILLAGFSASASSVMPHSQLFSQLACIAVLVALVGDLVLLPALLSVFYQKRG